mgnify:CR=1 FL=1
MSGQLDHTVNVYGEEKLVSELPKLVATSVVRGSQQGESHGGVYTIDFESQECLQHVDWNTGEIDFEGRGADRGLRGIDVNNDDIHIAASDELFCYDRSFKLQRTFRNRYLKHCDVISRSDQTLFLTSTGFDFLLAFDLAANDFIWGMQLQKQGGKWEGVRFDPRTQQGPHPSNEFHINMVHVNENGIFLSGLKTGALLHVNSNFEVLEICNLPQGVHNAQPYGDGIILNDTASNHVRYVGRDGVNKAFKIITYAEEDIEFAGIDDSKVARQGFGRGLCPVDDRFLAGGSSPSTVTLYDLQAGEAVASVNLTMDIRNAIHGLEVWA